MQWTKSREELSKLLRDLPAYLSGKIPDPTGIIAGMYREMGREALAVIHEQFRLHAEGAGPGNYWEDITEYTVKHSRNKARRELAPDEAQPLMDTLRLYKSLDPDSPTGDTVLRETDNGCQGGTAVPYADRHQKGLLSSRLSVPTPVRTIIPDWDEWPPEGRVRVLKKMSEGVQRFLEAMATV